MWVQSLWAKKLINTLHVSWAITQSFRTWDEVALHWNVDSRGQRWFYPWLHAWSCSLHCLWVWHDWGMNSSRLSNHVFCWKMRLKPLLSSLEANGSLVPHVSILWEFDDRYWNGLSTLSPNFSASASLSSKRIISNLSW